MISEAQQTRTISKIKIKGRLKKMGNLGFWLNLRWPLPRPPIWAPLSGWFFYCFIQIYTLQNMKQLHGVLLAHLIYSGNYGQNYRIFKGLKWCEGRGGGGYNIFIFMLFSCFGAIRLFLNNKKVVQNYWVQKIFGSVKIFGQNKFWLMKMGSELLGLKHFSGPTIFLVATNFWRRMPPNT